VLFQTISVAESAGWAKAHLRRAPHDEMRIDTRWWARLRFAHPTLVAISGNCCRIKTPARHLIVSQLSDFSRPDSLKQAIDTKVKKSFVCRPSLYSRARVRRVTIDDILFNRMNSNLMVPAGCEVYCEVTRKGARPNGETPVTKIKTFSAVMILSAAIATPVFAQDAKVAAPHHTRVHERNYRGAYNSVTEAPRANTENYGFSGQDRQRIGGQDPDLNPPS
jgi:hypothetical protein